MNRRPVNNDKFFLREIRLTGTGLDKCTSGSGSGIAFVFIRSLARSAATRQHFYFHMPRTIFMNGRERQTLPTLFLETEIGLWRCTKCAGRECGGRVVRANKFSGAEPQLKNQRYEDVVSARDANASSSSSSCSFRTCFWNDNTFLLPHFPSCGALADTGPKQRWNAQQITRINCSMFRLGHLQPFWRWWASRFHRNRNRRWDWLPLLHWPSRYRQCPPGWSTFWCRWFLL